MDVIWPGPNYSHLGEDFIPGQRDYPNRILSSTGCALSERLDFFGGVRALINLTTSLPENCADVNTNLLPHGSSSNSWACSTL